MNKLLVEGRDDKLVITNLLKKHGVNAQFGDTLGKPVTITSPSMAEFTIEDKDGIDGVLKNLRGLAVGINITAVGIVIDADEHLTERWQSIRDILTGSGYANAPIAPSSGGTIISTNQKPTIGIWIMPNNQLHGKLEDFISFLVPQQNDGSLWKYAESCIAHLLSAQAPGESETRFAVKDRSKALIHTWLAWQENPGYPLGTAVNKYLDAHAEQARLFISWINTLFNPQT